MYLEVIMLMAFITISSYLDERGKERERKKERRKKAYRSRRLLPHVTTGHDGSRSLSKSKSARGKKNKQTLGRQNPGTAFIPNVDDRHSGKFAQKEQV